MENRFGTKAELRPGTPADAGACGLICYDAFHSIATAHGFPPDFPSLDLATALIGVLLSHPGVYSVVVEADGRVAGSAFLDHRSPIAGVGPVTVAVDAQDRGFGRLLMEDVLRRARERAAAGVRLVQATYHTRSLSLYAKLGFEVRELLACLQGPPPGTGVPGYDVRPGTEEDVDACDALGRRIHGVDRHGEVDDAVRHGQALVVEHDGRISGYSTGLAF
ncbi:MAG TPA: GNAT family N-acetyltransferase, partial [Acidimicrobiia bacterium]|nr:GNAT family N-acetyltransferase [Acidimicrobiia bacterium]